MNKDHKIILLYIDSLPWILITMLILRSTEHLFAYQDPLQYFEVCGACMQPQVLSNFQTEDSVQLWTFLQTEKEKLLQNMFMFCTLTFSPLPL